MTSLPTATAGPLSQGCPAPEPAAPPPGWISARRAAMAMGLAPRTVARRCQDGRLPGLLCRGVFGPEWYVDPGRVPVLAIALGGLRTPVAAGAELAGLTDSQRAGVSVRFLAVREWQTALADRPNALTPREFATHWCAAYAAINAIPPFSPSTLYRWVAAVEAGGAASLVDRRGRPRGQNWDAEAMAFIVGQYLDESRPQLSICYERAQAIARARGWLLPSYSTVARYVARRLDPKRVMAARNPRQFRDRCVPDVLRDWSLIDANECWVGDHRRFDVFLPMEREIRDRRTGRASREWCWARPWITAFIDARTWKPVAWRIRFEDPNGRVVMETFCQGVSRHGLPEHAYLDNGKDFRMKAFSGGRRKAADDAIDEEAVKPILETLGVSVTFAQPYNAQAKVIEPWFRLVSERFDRCWPTYCGNREDRKPERLKLLRGRAAEFAARGYTIEAFSQAFDRWVTADYERRECPVAASRGLSVADAFVQLRAEGHQVRRPSEQDLALLLAPSRPVVVAKNGVWVQPLARWFWSDDLEHLRCVSGRDEARKVVYRWRSDTPDRIWVFDRKGRFLAVATPYAYADMDPLARPGTPEAERLKDAIAAKRRFVKAMTESVRDLRLDSHDLLLSAARAGALEAGRLSPPTAEREGPAGPAVVPMLPEISRAAMAASPALRMAGGEPLSPARGAADTFANAQTTDAGGGPGWDRSAAGVLAEYYAREPHDGNDDDELDGRAGRPDGAAG